MSKLVYTQNGPLDGSIVVIESLPRFSHLDDVWSTDEQGVFGYTEMPGANMVHPGTKQKYPLYTFGPLNPISLICEDLREAARHLKTARSYILRAIASDWGSWKAEHMDSKCAAGSALQDAALFLRAAKSMEDEQLANLGNNSNDSSLSVGGG